ncbi:hypothetical protein N2152v2_008400 [Parachlorella kessleri]
MYDDLTQSVTTIPAFSKPGLQVPAPWPPQSMRAVTFTTSQLVTHGQQSSSDSEAGERRALCQVPGCSRPLQAGDPRYYKKFKVCRAHSNACELEFAGKRVRFCQQCGKFQPLDDFEGDRKSCRDSLVKHNMRRRLSRKLAREASISAAAASGEAKTATPAPSPKQRHPTARGKSSRRTRQDSPLQSSAETGEGHLTPHPFSAVFTSGQPLSSPLLAVAGSVVDSAELPSMDRLLDLLPPSQLPAPLLGWASAPVGALGSPPSRRGGGGAQQPSSPLCGGLPAFLLCPCGGQRDCPRCQAGSQRQQQQAQQAQRGNSGAQLKRSLSGQLLGQQESKDLGRGTGRLPWLSPQGGMEDSLAQLLAGTPLGSLATAPQLLGDHKGAIANPFAVQQQPQQWQQPRQQQPEQRLPASWLGAGVGAAQLLDTHGEQGSKPAFQLPQSDQQQQQLLPPSPVRVQNGKGAGLPTAPAMGDAGNGAAPLELSPRQTYRPPNLEGELERVSYQVFKVPPSMLAPHVLEGVLSLLRRGVDPAAFKQVLFVFKLWFEASKHFINGSMSALLFFRV